MIRNATLADVPAMLEIYRPYVVETAITFEYEVPSLEEFTARFREITAQFPWLVWEENGEILGYCYGSRAYARAAYQWDADLSIYLRQDCRGRGIGRKLYTAAEECLLRQGYFLIYALVTSANEVSCAFHESRGYHAAARFPQCGWKFGKWYDVTWYEKRIRTGDPQNPPTAWLECTMDN